jgi:hypothetical protein
LASRVFERITHQSGGGRFEELQTPERATHLQRRRCRQSPVGFHGGSRSNVTLRSITDPDASLYRKGKGKEAKLFFLANPLMVSWWTST